ncbi:DNA circularization protein [Methylobacillus pratensis]
MAWQDELLAASFRGVAFHVESEEMSGGRRGQLHEYPFRDTPYFEDTGLKARTKNVSAYVIGPEYMAARDALLEALEAKGAGDLVLPWTHSLQMAVETYRLVHSNAEGGMCRFDISFVQAGEVTFPTARIATSRQTISAVEVLEETAIEQFSEVFDVDGLPAYGVEDAIAAAEGAVSEIEGAVGKVGGVLNNPIGSLEGVFGDMVNNPVEMGRRLFGIFSKVGAVITTSNNMVTGYSISDAINLNRALTTLRALGLFQRETRSGSTTPIRTQILDNRDAINDLMRAAIITQVGGMTAVMPLPVYDDAEQLRNETLAAIDDEMLQANDDIYVALADLRAKIHTDMSTRMQESVRLREIVPVQVQPGLVLAYDLYESVDREGEIIARNRIRNPGFVPTEPLKVLAS